MAKREKRYHLYLDPDDVEWYKGTFGGDLGLSRAIREVMRSYRAGIEAKLAAQHSPRRLTDDDKARILGGLEGKGSGSHSGD